MNIIQQQNEDKGSFLIEEDAERQGMDHAWKNNLKFIPGCSFTRKILK